MRTDLDPDANLRLEGYIHEIGGILRNKKRRASFATYAMGLLGEGERKSVEPIAARACGDPERTRAVTEQLLHFVGESKWEDEPVRAFAAGYALDVLLAREALDAWVVDDTGFLKQGTKSPGVQRQYTGSAGKVTNCQLAVSLTVCTPTASLPVDMDLYLPESWTENRARCKVARIPATLGYRPKWRIALDIIERALEWGVPRALVLADSAYGTAGEFRTRLRELGFDYAVDVKSNVSVIWIPPGGSEMKPMPVEALADVLPSSAYRKVTWRQGTRRELSSRFAMVRVRVTHDVRQEEQWLLIERPNPGDKPTHYVLSTLPESTTRKQLVRRVKQRWRIERTYEDMKGELGLDHFEGRSYPGWQHHVTCVLACYAFIAAEQARRFPPSARGTESSDALTSAA